MGKNAREAWWVAPWTPDLRCAPSGVTGGGLRPVHGNRGRATPNCHSGLSTCHPGSPIVVPDLIP